MTIYDFTIKTRPGTELSTTDFKGKVLLIVNTAKYKTQFDQFAKIEVNGKDAHPLYEFLKSQKKGALGLKAIKWNFTKFLVDRKGNVVNRYEPTTTPEQIEQDIIALL